MDMRLVGTYRYRSILRYIFKSNDGYAGYKTKKGNNIMTSYHKTLENFMQSNFRKTFKKKYNMDIKCICYIGVFVILRKIFKNIKLWYVALKE